MINGLKKNNKNIKNTIYHAREAAIAKEAAIPRKKLAKMAKEKII